MPFYKGTFVCCDRSEVVKSRSVWECKITFEHKENL